MGYVSTTLDKSIAVITLSRGKVQALNEGMIAELGDAFTQLAADADVRAVVLTGSGKFFSFGFDIPELYERSQEEMTAFVRSYCDLYHRMFLFPKPLVAAVNGHAVAGGCILALACDYRLMVDQSAKMSLNEVTFGASLFAGVVTMLRYWVGNRNAEEVLLTGRMYGPQECVAMRLVEGLASPTELLTLASDKARELAEHYGPAYVSLKGRIRRSIVEEWLAREEESIQEWIRIWYSPETRVKAKGIQIRG